MSTKFFVVNIYYQRTNLLLVISITDQTILSVNIFPVSLVFIGKIIYRRKLNGWTFFGDQSYFVGKYLWLWKIIYRHNCVDNYFYWWKGILVGNNFFLTKLVWSGKTMSDIIIFITKIFPNEIHISSAYAQLIYLYDKHDLW